MSIEHGTFTQLIFSVTRGAGQECSRYHRHLAEQISAIIVYNKLPFNK